MKYIDVRLTKQDISEFQSMINKIFNYMQHDPFNYGTGVYGIVGFCIGNINYSFTNKIAVVDYFGKTEDVAIFKFNKLGIKQAVSFTNNKMINYPVKQVIKKIRIINEHQQLFYNDEQVYDVQITRGIIFELEDDREISFEKAIWFSEEIYIEKGNNLLKKFQSVDSFLDDWEEGYIAKCSREEIIIN